MAVWVGRGRRRGAAECSGGCGSHGSHGVAGAGTVGIRSGTCPIPLGLIKRALRSSVGMIPLSFGESGENGEQSGGLRILFA